eukprot:3774323-Rhodomonas_salina.1
MPTSLAEVAVVTSLVARRCIVPIETQCFYCKQQGTAIAALLGGTPYCYYSVSRSREVREEFGLEGHPLWGWHAPTDLVYSN